MIKSDSKTQFMKSIKTLIEKSLKNGFSKFVQKID